MKVKYRMGARTYKKLLRTKEFVLRPCPQHVQCVRMLPTPAYNVHYHTIPTELEVQEPIH